MDKEILGTCPKCGKNIIENKACYYCEDKDCGFKLFKTVCDAKIDKENLNKLLNKKETDVYDMTSSKGNKFKAKLKLKNDYSGVEFIFNQNNEEVIEVGKCPRCGKMVVVKNGLYGDYYKCSNNSCDFKINGIIAGTTMTKNLVIKLLDEKRLDAMTFTSKQNKKFKAGIILEDNGNIQFDFNNK